MGAKDQGIRDHLAQGARVLSDGARNLYRQTADGVGLVYKKTTGVAGFVYDTVAQRGAIVYKESATSISSTKSQARLREALCLQSIPVVIFHRLAVMPPTPSRTESVVGAMIVFLTPV